MVGVAYLDDSDRNASTGRGISVPVIAAQYPSSEVLYAQRPDGGGRFRQRTFGKSVTHARTLADNGVASYLLSACAGHSLDCFRAGGTCSPLAPLLHKSQRARETGDALDADLHAQALADNAQPVSVFLLGQ